MKMNTIETLTDAAHGKIYLDPAMMTLIHTSFSETERALLAESIRDIGANITDVFDDMSNKEMMQARHITYQALFNELAQVIPHYIPLLKTSMLTFGDETFFEKQEVADVLGTEALKNKQFFPKLLIEDGTREYALMQIAAYKAGLPDDNLRLWYFMLYGLMTSFKDPSR